MKFNSYNIKIKYEHFLFEPKLKLTKTITNTININITTITYNIRIILYVCSFSYCNKYVLSVDSLFTGDGVKFLTLFYPMF